MASHSQTKEVSSRQGGFRHLIAAIGRNKRGAVLVESAFALPIVITMLMGIINYGTWFMAAHSLQEAANNSARAALGGLDNAERNELVDRSIAASVLNAGTLSKELVTVKTDQSADYFTVTLSYDADASPLLKHSIVPLPGDTITRTAVVKLASL